MAHPVVYVPLLTTNPLGWAILGAAGYVAYKVGKKAGLQSTEELEKECLTDRVVKGAMKTAYKAKLKTDAAIAETREKYSGMWHEAREEATAKK